MQKQLLMALGIALAFGSAAHANTPVNPQMLGLVDGVLSYCTDIDQRNEQKYRKLRRTLTGGASDEQLDKAKNNPEYHASRKLMHGTFREMPLSDAMRLCTEAIK